MKLAIVVAFEKDVKPLGLKGNFEDLCKKVKDLGYEGVELFIKDPSLINANRIKEIARSYELEIPAVGTGASYVIYGLSLADPNETVRRKAIERVIEYGKICGVLNSSIIIGSMKGKVEDRKKGWENLVSSLKECCKKVREFGVKLLIEPLNRYESNLVNTAKEGLKLIEEVGEDNIALMLDVFHMNIEEEDLLSPFEISKEKLEHVHFADNNRLAPGKGHIDFKEIIKKLKLIGYGRFISIEAIPSTTLAEDSVRFLFPLLKGG